MTRVEAVARRGTLAVVVSFVVVSCGGTAKTSATPGAIVRGTVTAGPTCPVERVGHPCPPRPLLATIAATIGARVIASTRSAANGSYRLDLPAGTYTLSAETATALPRCEPKGVSVLAGETVEVDLVCDTGIR